MHQAQGAVGWTPDPYLGRRAPRPPPRSRRSDQRPGAWGVRGRAAPSPYTPVDSLLEASVFRPPLVDISPALRGEPLPPGTVDQVGRGPSLARSGALERARPRRPNARPATGARAPGPSRVPGDRLPRAPRARRGAFPPVRPLPVGGRPV
jgi:hypothetical protein